MSEKMLRIEEVAMIIGSSTQTIDNWYRWKREEPEHELAKLLPDYEQEGGKKTATRYWKQSDVWKLIEFKNSIPKGCKGVLGKVTQKYLKKKEEEK